MLQLCLFPIGNRRKKQQSPITDGNCINSIAAMSARYYGRKAVEAMLLRNSEERDNDGQVINERHNQDVNKSVDNKDRDDDSYTSIDTVYQHPSTAEDNAKRYFIEEICPRPHAWSNKARELTGVRRMDYSVNAYNWDRRQRNERERLVKELFGSLSPNVKKAPTLSFLADKPPGTSRRGRGGSRRRRRAPAPKIPARMPKWDPEMWIETLDPPYHVYWAEWQRRRRRILREERIRMHEILREQDFWRDVSRIAVGLGPHDENLGLQRSQDGAISGSRRLAQREPAMKETQRSRPLPPRKLWATCTMLTLSL